MTKVEELRRLRVAVIGLGAWGTRAHLATLAARDDVEVVAIVEPDSAEAAMAAARYSVPRVELDAAALWANPGEIDAVVIATPVDTHYRQVIGALAAGCHVLCEKPLAYDLPQAEEMHRVAGEAGVVAKLGFLMRFSPVVARMKELVDEGYIGELRGFEFHSVNAQFIDPERPRHWKMERSRANGGVFAEYGSHGIDLALWFGGPITKVVAHGTTAISARPLHGGGRGAVDVDDMTAWIGVYANGGDATFRTRLGILADRRRRGADIRVARLVGLAAGPVDAAQRSPRRRNHRCAGADRSPRPLAGVRPSDRWRFVSARPLCAIQRGAR